MSQFDLEPIFAFSDYREYLKSCLGRLKEKHSVSQRKFAESAGFGSHSYLQKILKGESIISEASARKIARGLELDANETTYFENLVRFNQAETLDDQNLYYARLIEARPASEIHNIEKSHYRIFSKWYHIAIRELVGAKDFVEDPQKIAVTLVPNISPEEVETSIALLKEIGYLAYDETGKLVQTEPNISTGAEVHSLHVSNYHRALIELSQKALDSSSDWRDISSTSVMVNRDEFLHIKQEIIDFRKKMLRYLEERKDLQAQTTTGDEQVLYMLNVQWFAAGEIPWKTKKKQ